MKTINQIILAFISGILITVLIITHFRIKEIEEMTKQNVINHTKLVQDLQKVFSQMQQSVVQPEATPEATKEILEN